MEGLLPMVYKAIKKNNTRRKYECLSSGASKSCNTNMTEMIYIQTQGRGYQNHSTQNVANDHAEKISYRRYNSTGDFSNGFSSLAQQRNFGAASSDSKQLMRFRSHRMFSCISGM
ncbi:hypothetical protein TanjilG_06316 [Lupinus angustifolius]|uniref:Uncharacterized protein n=1 Tax=Lupinus angustifolius TaxID=3871 RepID=A0A1J7IUS3_LUPAN|nr:PREDICTED: uncharacterized protein LOC109327124 [Lupinus angustifolius]OIW18232.1 hypothetical protein TanjilG_06316 [Lupinus angustifolius]